MRDAGSKNLFRKARMQYDESLRLYAARLEKLYRLAYPHRHIENSRTLREKFYDTVPRHFRKQLQNMIAFNKSMTGSSVAWLNITQLASQQDALREQEESTADES